MDQKEVESYGFGCAMWKQKFHLSFGEGWRATPFGQLLQTQLIHNIIVGKVVDSQERSN